MWGGESEYKCDGFSEDGGKQMRTWLGDQKRVLKLRGWGPFAAQKLMGSKHNLSGSQSKQMIRTYNINSYTQLIVRRTVQIAYINGVEW
jgi:hypothetical protein